MATEVEGADGNFQTGWRGCHRLGYPCAQKSICLLFTLLRNSRPSNLLDVIHGWWKTSNIKADVWRRSRRGGISSRRQAYMDHFRIISALRWPFAVSVRRLPTAEVSHAKRGLACWFICGTLAVFHKHGWAAAKLKTICTPLFREEHFQASAKNRTGKKKILQGPKKEIKTN